MKKLALFVVTIFLCFSMISCKEEPQNNGEQFDDNSQSDNHINEKDSGSNDNINQEENHNVPYLVSFSSIAEMEDFFSSTKGNIAQYEEFIQENNINTSISQSHAQTIVAKVESGDIPLVKSDWVVDDFAATYYLDRNELDMIYQINGIRYRFVYRYDKTSTSVRTTSPVLKNLKLGTYVVDLYQGNGCFVGEFLTASAVVQIVVYTERTSDVVLNAFNMEPVAKPQ